MLFYTGLTSIAQFETLFLLLSPYLPKIQYCRGAKRILSTKVRYFTKKNNKKLTLKNEFLLTLMRLRLGTLNEDNFFNSSSFNEEIIS